MNMPVQVVSDYRTYDTSCRWRLGQVGHQAVEFVLTRNSRSISSPVGSLLEQRISAAINDTSLPHVTLSDSGCGRIVAEMIVGLGVRHRRSTLEWPDRRQS
jgi:hypothetical protein